MNIKKYIKLIPAIIFVTIVPLIVKIKILDFPIGDLIWNNYPSRYANLFTYYKGIFAIISAIIALFILFKIIFLDKRKIKLDKYKIIIIISLFFILLATFLSEYKFISLRGDIRRAEGLFVLVSYFIMVIYTSEVFRKKYTFDIMIKGIYI